MTVRVVLYSRIIYFGLLGSLIPMQALAEDKTDVASGFFKKNMVNEMFAPREVPTGEAPSPKTGSESEPGNKNPAPDSFSVGQPNSKEPPDSASEGNWSVTSAVNDPQAIARSLRESEKVITEVQERVQHLKELPADDSGIAQAIEAARSVSQQPSPKHGSQSRAMFGGMDLPTENSDSKALLVDTQRQIPPPSDTSGEAASLHPILSTSPVAEFELQLKIIQRIINRGIIPIKQISVKGLNRLQHSAAIASASHEVQDDDRPQPSVEERALALFNSLNTSLDGTISSDEVAARYQTSQYPLWIVKVSGSQHVFPGQIDPRTLFDGAGSFIAADRGVLDGQSDSARIIRHRGANDYRAPASEAANTTLTTTVLTYHLQKGSTRMPVVAAEAPANTFVLEPLSQCVGENVRRVKVPTLSATRKIDIVFFSPLNATDASIAQRWRGAAIAYDSGARIPLGTREAVLKRLASSLRVRCLPTRFHFTHNEGVSFLEYREGSTSAWQDTSSPVSTAVK